MAMIPKKKSLSELLRAKTNPLSNKSGKAPASRPGLLTGPIGADRAREAFDHHRKAVQAAQQTFKDTLKRNRGY
ncbi:MAG TPA: hypothetical protein VF443_05655 [Nitrospira sp.]